MKLLNYLKALSDKTRLRLFNILLNFELNVNEIVSVLGMSQPAISRHLKVLLDNRLVQFRRDGLWIFYSVVNSGESRDFIDSIKVFLNTEDDFKEDLQKCKEIINGRTLETTKFFNKVAGDWGKLKQNIVGNLNINSEITKHMNKCRLAVDIGCGTGDLIPDLLTKADNVIGVDRSPKMLEQAKKYLSAEADRLSLRLGDLEHLPLSNNEADFAVANMVLHHLSSPLDAIQEIYRILKKKRKFIIIDFLKHDNEQMRKKYGDRWLGFSSEKIKNWLMKTNFAIQETINFNVQNELTIMLFVSEKQ